MKFFVLASAVVVLFTNCSSSNEPSTGPYTGIVFRDINGRLNHPDGDNDPDDWHSIPFDCSDNCLLQPLAYPNPTDSVVLVQFTTAYSSMHHIAVLDKRGRTVARQELTDVQPGTHIILMDLSNIEDGMYRIKFYAREKEAGAPLYETYGDVLKGRIPWK